jgi:hypothetical protein
MDAKVGHFQKKTIKALCCCPTFLLGTISLGVNTPSSCGNVNFANGHTNRILVPYREEERERERERSSGQGQGQGAEGGAKYEQRRIGDWTKSCLLRVGFIEVTNFCKEFRFI